MAQQTRIKFGDMYLLKGDRTTNPMQFTAPCGITQFGKNVTTNTADVELRDCDDPDAPTWLGIDVVSKRMTLNLSGTLDQEAYRNVWRNWFMSKDAEPIRVYERVGTTGWGYWEGNGVMTNYDDTANGGGTYTNSATIIFDGMPVWVGTPPAPSVTSSVSVSEVTAPDVGTAFVATPGVYTGTPTFSYQWYADGAPISGATSASYTPVLGNVGKRLRVVEVATNASGSATTRSDLSLPVVS